MVCVIDGRSISNKLCRAVSAYVRMLKEEHSVVPGLAVVMVGGDPASSLYVANKQKKAVALGVDSKSFFFESTVSQDVLLNKIRGLNEEKSVDGVLVQLPLPPHIDAHVVIEAVKPSKDVDGFHSENVGKLVSGRSDAFVPCTPQGCIYLIKTLVPDLSGVNSLVIGRSNIVGKPMFHLLLRENSTVTIAHSMTTDLGLYCKNADIIVSAVGKPGLLSADIVKPGAIVIDVGINCFMSGGERRFVGDVDFNSVSKVAGAVTPVPGGVGPMTIVFLMVNTVIAACRRRGIRTSAEEIFSYDSEL